MKKFIFYLLFCRISLGGDIFLDENKEYKNLCKKFHEIIDIINQEEDGSKRESIIKDYELLLIEIKNKYKDREIYIEINTEDDFDKDKERKLTISERVKLGLLGFIPIYYVLNRAYNIFNSTEPVLPCIIYPSETIYDGQKYSFAYYAPWTYNTCQGYYSHWSDFITWPSCLAFGVKCLLKAYKNND